MRTNISNGGHSWGLSCKLSKVQEMSDKNIHERAKRQKVSLCFFSSSGGYNDAEKY